MAKFNNTFLNVVHYGPAAYLSEDPDDINIQVKSSNSRQIITIDQNNIYRVHKLKGAKIMAEKDFLAKEGDFEDPGTL